MRRSGSHHILTRPTLDTGLFDMCSGRREVESPPSHLPPPQSKKVSIKQLKKSLTLKPRPSQPSFHHT